MTDQEINEAVAKKLGWEKHNRTCEQLTPGASIFTYGNHWYQEGALCRERMPNYCHSIEAAWEIVKNQTVTLDNCHGVWHCGISVDTEEEWVEDVADTAPMAICKAFLTLK
jgi:hypothetical protein